MSILISHETPLSMLEDSNSYNDYQYLLPYFYYRYPKYREFMNNYQGMIIADNGLFEGETYTIQQQIELIKESKPTIYIVQDEWNDSILTLKNAKYWMYLKKNGTLPEELNLMVVLQGKTFGEIEILYQQCIDLGYRHFAFNHSSIAYQNEVESLEGELTKAKVGRISLIKRLYEKGILKKDHWIHLLGASDITEFTYYNQALPGVVNSLDTSNPIIKTIEEGLYTEENIKIKSKNKLEKYFENKFDPLKKDCILENIKYFKNLINNKLESYEYTK